MARSKQGFPKSFLWGASTSAHQHEGGNYNQWTVWELENARIKATQAQYIWESTPGWEKFAKEAKNPGNYVSGKSVNHYEKYKTDLALLKRLNMNSIRFSIEWSRIEPEEGKWNAEEVEHYKRYLDECARLEITPIVTLFHFTLPVWFAEKGGFRYRRNIKYFERFCEKIAIELGSRFKYCITINEPTVYAGESYYSGNWPPNESSWWSNFRVLGNLTVAHRRVVKVMKKAQPNLLFSQAFNLSYTYPGDDALLTRISAEVYNYISNTYTLNRNVRHCDFIGVNYYASNRVYGYRIHNPNRLLSDLGWDMQPSDIALVLEDCYERYKKPILVTENGVADIGDKKRRWWIDQTIEALKSARKRDVDLIGYTHWSLLDNFEWDKGFWPRFGLISVDRKNYRRRARESAKHLANIIKSEE
ncbi:glycoside hydrolase family 1 protein [Candidatus Nomurabacteria bacterium]|nr:glycoside hydrolase family 1 protein [Candidatus Nomurabacteria bacterium]